MAATFEHHQKSHAEALPEIAHHADMARLYTELGIGRREMPDGEDTDVTLSAVVESAPRTDTLSSDAILELMDRIATLRNNVFDTEEKLKGMALAADRASYHVIREWLDDIETGAWNRLCSMRPEEAHEVREKLGYAPDEKPSIALVMRHDATIMKTDKELTSLAQHLSTEAKRNRAAMRKAGIDHAERDRLQTLAAGYTARAKHYTNILQSRTTS